MSNLRQKVTRYLIAVSQKLPQSLRRPLQICSRFSIRVSAFILKEIFEIARQPLLILTLVLGPFLILLFFGLGYRNEPRALRTMFVVEDAFLTQSIKDNVSNFGPQLIFAGITNDVTEAQNSLRNGDIDLVTVIPADAYKTVLNNRRAPILLYHHEIDPFQLDYISVFGRVYVDEANRRILRYIFTEGQAGAQKIQQKLELARQTAEKEIATRLKGVNVSARIVQLLQEPWKDFLAFIFLRHGPDSAIWRSSVKVIDGILWTVNPDKISQRIDYTGIESN